MIVERMAVKHWRGFRDEHVFKFDRGLNLLLGLNEAGKSTLFEVLQRTFFDRHTGRAQEIKAMQPLASSLGPEAEIVVRTGDGRYRVRKRFLDSPLSELHLERGGSWELDHDGDEADARIRALLEGDVPGRGATKEEHRGLAQALWYLQRESPVPAGKWNEAVERGLQGLVEVVATTPEEEALSRAIEEVYEEHWTATGRLSTRSPLSDLRNEIPEMEEELADLREQLGEAQEHRETLESLAVQKEEKSRRLSEEKERAAGLEETLGQAEALEEEKRSAENRLSELKREEESASADLDRVQSLEEKIAEESEALDEANAHLAEAERDEQKAKAHADELNVKLNEEFKPRLREVEQTLGRLQSRRDLLKLEKEEDRLQAVVEELGSARAEAKRLKSRVAKLNAPSEDELDELREKERALDRARVRAESAAIRVRFELDYARAVEAEPEAEREEEEYLITGATEFRIEDVGSIHVRGGGQDLEDVREQIATLQEDLEADLRRYGATEIGEAVELRQERVDLEAKLATAQEKVSKLEKGVDPEEELARVRNEVEAARRSSQGLSDELLSLEMDELRSRLGSVEEERTEISNRVDELAEGHSRAQDALLQAVDTRGKASQTVGELDTRVKSLKGQKADILEQYGTLERLEALVEEAGKKRKAQESALEALDAEYREKVKEPREELKRVQKTIEGLAGDLQDVEKKITAHTAKIETLTARGLYSRIGDLEAELDLKKRRLPVLERRVEAARLLKQLVDAFQKERSGALAGPVAERVGTWLGEITGDTYSALELGTGLLPTSVRFERYDSPLDITELSYGTREQVVVLLRLAMGVLLSEEEPRLVVLDDRLVNADPVRMRRFRPILEEVCDSCQVLLATCNDAAYAGMEAAVVRVPEDGRGGGV